MESAPPLETPSGGDEETAKEWEEKMTGRGRTNTQILLSLWTSMSDIV